MRCSPPCLPSPKALPAWGALLALAPAAAGATPLTAEYEVHAAGLTVMRIEATFDLDGPGGFYGVATRIRMTGMAGLFNSGDQVTRVEGRWQGTEPRPRHYRVEGRWRGAPRQVAMEYGAGGVPAVLALVPGNENREAVPPALQRDTIDGLSALAKLSRTVAQTGRCDTAAATFDGRRRADYTVRTAGLEMLPAGQGYAGQALRCTFESRLIAGRQADQDAAEAQRPQTATAWLAPVGPGRTMLPVRIDLPSRWFGAIRAQLVSVVPAPAGSAAQELAEQRR